MSVKPVIKFGALALIAIVTVYALVELAFYVRFERAPSAANYPEPVNMAEARLQDVDYLTNFIRLERSWSPENLRRASALLESLRNTAATMTDSQFEMAVAEIVAAADNAHTKVREYARTPRYNRLPIRGHWFADGYHVIRAHEGYQDLLGAEVTHIGAIPMAELEQQLGRYLAGPAASIRKYAPYILESPDLMFGTGLTSETERLTVTLRLPNGEVRDVEFSAPFPDSSEQIARSHLLLTTRVYAESQPAWHTLHKLDEQLPLYLRGLHQQLYRSRLPEQKLSYLQMATNNNTAEQSISELCEASWQEFLAEGDKLFVVDLRYNGGGNFYNTKSCLSKIGRELPDDAWLYVIVAGPTFSAGIYSAAFALSEAPPERSVLIGEAMGDRLQSWAEDNTMTLPNSDIEVNYSTGMHDLQSPCRSWRRCYWGAMFESVTLASNQPEVVVPQTFEFYARREDPVLGRILEE